jgi:hypothetical protein
MRGFVEIDASRTEGEMIKGSTSVKVARPGAEVFRFVANDHFVNHPRWDPDIRIEQTTPGPVGEGTRGRFSRRMAFGRRMTADLLVDRFVPGRAFGIRMTSGTAGRFEYSIDPIDDASSRLTMDYEMEPKGAAQLLEPLMARFMAKGTATATSRIKALIETGP